VVFRTEGQSHLFGGRAALVNSSGDPNSEYLSDGITEASSTTSPRLPATSRDGAHHRVSFQRTRRHPQKIGRDSTLALAG